MPITTRLQLTGQCVTMPPRTMNKVSWFAYRHPFVASVAGAGLTFVVSKIYGAPTSWGVVAAVATAIIGLVMWWPRHGVFTRDLDDWLADEDPRVRKPGDP